jgi:hypothetical protein
MRRILSTFLCLLLTFGLVNLPAYALDKATKITINGKEIKFSKTTGLPYNVKSQVFVPINVVAQVMGYKTSIKGTTAIVALPTKNITFKVGDSNNTVKSKDGKIMSPISKIAPLLGYKVETISSNLINIKKQIVQTTPKISIQKPVTQPIPKISNSNVNSSTKTNQNLFQTIPVDENSSLYVEGDCH